MRRRRKESPLLKKNPKVATPTKKRLRNKGLRRKTARKSGIRNCPHSKKIEPGRQDQHSLPNRSKAHTTLGERSRYLAHEGNRHRDMLPRALLHSPCSVGNSRNLPPIWIRPQTETPLGSPSNDPLPDATPAPFEELERNVKSAVSARAMTAMTAMTALPTRPRIVTRKPVLSKNRPTCNGLQRR